MTDTYRHDRYGRKYRDGEYGRYGIDGRYCNLCNNRIHDEWTGGWKKGVKPPRQFINHLALIHYWEDYEANMGFYESELTPEEVWDRYESDGDYTFEYYYDWVASRMH